MAETHDVIVRQNEDERFALDHAGGVALYGAKDEPALQHQFAGQVVHTTHKPLVHMICWEEEEPCPVELSGKVTLATDKDAPLEVRMSHHFANTHHQTLSVEPLQHGLKVDTKLAEPIHHALQLRTPLQLRFANPWHLASDYMVQVNLGDSRLITIRLTGATVATPQPPPGEPPC